MQINKLFKVVYDKTTYEDAIFVGANLRINIKTYLFEKAKLKNKSSQTNPYSSELQIR